MLATWDPRFRGPETHGHLCDGLRGPCVSLHSGAAVRHHREPGSLDTPGKEQNGGKELLKAGALGGTQAVLEVRLAEAPGTETEPRTEGNTAGIFAAT